MRRSLTIIILILGISVAANSQSLQYVNSTLWSGINDYKISGDFAYCAMRNGLAIINLTIPESPQFISQLYCDGQGNDIEIVGNTVYLADGRGCLQIIDVSDPLNPVLLGGYHEYCNATEIAISGSYAFLTGNHHSFFNGIMVVVDFENPMSPTLVGTSNWAGNDIAISGNYAFIAGTGLKILDISSPGNPYQVASYFDDNEYNDIQIVNNIIYCTVDNTGFIAIDIADPLSPILVGTSEELDDLSSLFVNGNRAYITQTFSGLYVFNISDPATLVVDTILTLPNATHLLAGDQNRLLLTNSNLGVCYYDITQSDIPIFRGRLPWTGGANEIALDGSYAYIAANSKNLYIVDKSRLDNPVITGACTTSIVISDMVATNNHILAVGQRGLNIFDVNNPQNPYICGSYLTSRAFSAVRANGNYAYLVTRGHDLTVLDISNFNNPESVRVDNTIWAADIDLIGNYAYIAQMDRGMAVLDLSDSSYPHLYGNANIGNIFYDNIKVSGVYAYLSCSAALVDIYNVADPAHPHYVTRITTAGVNSEIDIAGDYLYVAGLDGGAQLFNIADPLNPSLIMNYLTPGEMDDIKVDGNNIFIADNYSLIFLANTPDGIADDDIAPRAFALHQNYPNPFNARTTFSFDLPKSEHVALIIYDITGRKIAEPLNAFLIAGSHSLTWDAQNFSSGVYFARMGYGGNQSSIKMILLK